MKNSKPEIEATYNDWLKRGSSMLKGQPLDKIARRPQKGGLNWKVLHTAEDLSKNPGSEFKYTQPSVAALAAFSDGANEPELIQKYSINPLADASKLSQLLLQDLEGGVSGISFSFEEFLAQTAGDKNPTLKFWKQLLTGIDEELVSFEIPLTATNNAACANSLFLPSLLPAFSKQPKSIAAKFSISHDLTAQFDCFAELHARIPVIEVLFEASTLHDRGANSLLELASILSFRTELLRRFGGSEPILTDRFKVRLSVTSNILGSISKVRAARLLWAQHVAFRPSSQESAPLRVYAETSAAELSRYDTWTNILRTSSQCAAALMANCNGVTVLAHDIRAVVQNPFSHRIARNAFNVLVNECHLAKIADPLGGSYAIEAHTLEMIEKANELHKELEAAGGLAAVWNNGWLAWQLQDSRKKLISEESFRKPGTIGVSEFPNANEWLDLLNHECVDLFARKETTVVLPHAFKKAFNPSEAAANWREPLFVSDMFASLREIVSLNWQAATGCNSFCFSLVAVGSVAELSPRISWVENVFGTLGLTRHEVFTNITEETDWQEKLRQGLPDNLMPLQVLVASDSFYEINLPEFTEIVGSVSSKPTNDLGETKVRPVILVAGRIKPESFEQASKAGLFAALYAGANIFEILQQCLRRIGVDQ